jgi:hypothetical protein
MRLELMGRRGLQEVRESAEHPPEVRRQGRTFRSSRSRKMSLLLPQQAIEKVTTIGHVATRSPKKKVPRKGEQQQVRQSSSRRTLRKPHKCAVVLNNQIEILSLHEI